MSIYTPDQLKVDITLDVRSSSFSAVCDLKTLYFLMYNKESAKLLWFCGGGGSGHAFSKFF